MDERDQSYIGSLSAERTEGEVGKEGWMISVILWIRLLEGAISCKENKLANIHEFHMFISILIRKGCIAFYEEFLTR
jgi:hypothetical protein